LDSTGKDDNGMICGGVAKVSIEPIMRVSTVHISSGGQISFKLGLECIEKKESKSKPDRGIICNILSLSNP
jgi:hypothetical protein